MRHSRRLVEVFGSIATVRLFAQVGQTGSEVSRRYYYRG